MKILEDLKKIFKRKKALLDLLAEQQKTIKMLVDLNEILTENLKSLTERVEKLENPLMEVKRKESITKVPTNSSGGSGHGSAIFKIKKDTV